MTVPGDDLALAVLGDGAEAQRRADAHLAQLLDQHRRAVRVGRDDRVLDLLDAVELARRRG